jgi:pimeloyl-ACP methyl ester carboxylesterase
VPALIVWGREDALVPVAYAAESGSRIAGSQVEVIDDCGHAPQAGQPERTWAAVSKPDNLQAARARQEAAVQRGSVRRSPAL